MNAHPSRQTVVVFDIDGTLLESAHLHHDLISEVLARDDLDVFFQPWSAYPHYTDRGVIDELMKHFRGRPADAVDLARYDQAYRTALLEYLDANPLREIAGATRLLKDLSDMPDVHLCFATGSLRKMAEIKLDILGIDARHAALATGSDFNSREEIVVDAIRQADDMAGAFDIVVLGDGTWDQHTAANLGMAFVAVQSGTHLFDDGPILVINNFLTLAAQTLVDLAQPFEPQTVAKFMSERRAK